MRLENHRHIQRKPVEYDSEDKVKKVAAALFHQPRQHSLPKMPREAGQKIENRLHECAAKTEEGTCTMYAGVEKSHLRATAGKCVDDEIHYETDNPARHDDLNQIPLLFFKAETVPVVQTYSTA
jgi:hypothetical protein